MFAQMDTQTLIFVGFAIAAAAFFIGSAMNGVLEGDGFGVVGNMTILVAGAFLGLYIADHFLHIPSFAHAENAVAAVSGGFLSLAFLATLKAVLHRVLS